MLQFVNAKDLQFYKQLRYSANTDVTATQTYTRAETTGAGTTDYSMPQTAADWQKPQTAADWQKSYKQHTTAELERDVQWQTSMLKSAQKDVAHSKGFERQRAQEQVNTWKNSLEGLNNASSMLNK